MMCYVIILGKIAFLIIISNYQAVTSNHKTIVESPCRQNDDGIFWMIAFDVVFIVVTVNTCKKNLFVTEQLTANWRDDFTAFKKIFLDASIYSFY